MSSSIRSLLPASFLDDFANLQYARYTSAAGITILLYDFILTFPAEFQHVWRGSKRITAVKLMFIWNRYLVIPWIIVNVYHFAGIRGRVSNEFCKVVIPSVALIQGVSMGVGMQLLALRVIALYRNRTAVKIGLYSFLAACHIALAVLAIIVLKKITPSLFYLEIAKSCYSKPPRAVGFIYLPPLLAETAIMTLQVLHHYRTRENRLVVRTPLIETMYRDGYLYFAAVMTVRVTCFCFFAFGPVSLWSFGNVLDFPLTCALISRFFLQLRTAIQDEEEASFFPSAQRTFPVAQIHTSRSRSRSRHMVAVPAVEVTNHDEDASGSGAGSVQLVDLKRIKPSVRLYP